MGEDRLRCKSGAACQRRLRAGTHLKRPVRLALEIATQLDEDTRTAVANFKEVERIEREVRNTYYRHGLCTACGVMPHSPGRPRCEQCHRGR
jgi:hypothetical protein